MGIQSGVLSAPTSTPHRITLLSIRAELFLLCPRGVIIQQIQVTQRAHKSTHSNSTQQCTAASPDKERYSSSHTLSADAAAGAPVKKGALFIHTVYALKYSGKSAQRINLVLIHASMGQSRDAYQEMALKSQNIVKARDNFYEELREVFQPMQDYY